MYAVVRRYQDVKPDVLAEIERRRDEVESLMLRVPGLITYHMIRTPGGLTSVTVCEDQDGAEESNNRVASWIREHMPTFLPNPPEISGGEVVFTTGR